jgi:GSCFA family protein
MNLHLNFTPAVITPPLRHEEPIMLIGSCFAENIAARLAALKFQTLHNPNGIIYDPISITNSVISYIEKRTYNDDDLFELNGLWHSWQHHGSFSGVDAREVLVRINKSQFDAHEFIKKAKWLFITLGSAFSYSLVKPGTPVANCHKAPGSSFRKSLLTIEDIKSSLDTCIHRLLHFNGGLQIIFTVSPVRYTRDGLVENNLSKARLIEVVQHLVSKFSGLHYFPAFEIVNDVLRDYRFFKEDMVHPSEQAIDYVFEAFTAAVLDKSSIKLAGDLGKLKTALAHRPLHPGAEAHRAFQRKLLQQMDQLARQYPHLDFTEERRLFND